MDTPQLRAFVEVARQQSFSTAAETLHLTQPAVSKRIAQLEQQLGAVLFDRAGKRVVLTHAGELLLPRARKILSELSDTERAVRDLSGTISGRLRLATSHHIGLHRLPSVLRAFSSAHPDVTLEIAFMDSEQAHALVLQGDTELAIITLAPAAPPPQLEAVTVWPDPLRVMVAQDHPLACDTQIAIQQLSAFPAVLPGIGTYTGQILQRLFDTHNAPLKISMSTNYLETLRMLASIGLGWTVLPESMRTAELIGLDLHGIQLERELGYVVRRDRRLSNAAQAFIRMLMTSDRIAPSAP